MLLLDAAKLSLNMKYVAARGCRRQMLWGRFDVEDRMCVPGDPGLPAVWVVGDKGGS